MLQSVPSQNNWGPLDKM